MPELPKVVDKVDVKTPMDEETKDDSVEKDEKSDLNQEPKAVEALKVIEDVNHVQAADHPDLSKYFKMMRVGVPEVSVMEKMSRDGFDPGLLADPTALIPKPEENHEI